MDILAQTEKENPEANAHVAFMLKALQSILAFEVGIYACMYVCMYVCMAIILYTYCTGGDQGFLFR